MVSYVLEMPYTLSKYRAMWKRIKETIDLHGATPHILRHSYLTYAVGSTTDFKTIQGISGHSDVFTLMNRYAHPQEDKVIELSNEIATILTQNVDKPWTPSRLINQGTEYSQKPQNVEK